jgi:divalent metal cation (Fe/Co/Zn/Cd) transporter
MRLVQDFAPEHRRRLALAKRVTATGMGVSGSLSASKLIVGWLAHSTAVFADGLENAGDLFGSGLVLYALHIASKPPDSDHPYGHGRSETIAGLAVGVLLGASGIAICYEGAVALLALALTLYDPQHFSAADHWGGFAVGLIVLFTALHVVRDTSNELMDAMPSQRRIERIRNVALSAPGVEVDPQMSVQESHELATATRFLIREKLDWVADVVVHIEPFTGGQRNQ